MPARRASLGASDSVYAISPEPPTNAAVLLEPFGVMRSASSTAPAERGGWKPMEYWKRAARPYPRPYSEVSSAPSMDIPIGMSSVGKAEIVKGVDAWGHDETAQIVTAAKKATLFFFIPALLAPPRGARLNRIALFYRISGVPARIACSTRPRTCAGRRRSADPAFPLCDRGRR